MRIKSALYAPILLFTVFLLTGYSGNILKVVNELSENTYLSIAIINFLVFLMPLAFYLKVRGIHFSEAVKVKAIKPRDIPFVLTAFSITLIGLAIIKYISLVTGGNNEIVPPITMDSGSNEALALLCFAIIPAILEELLFRSFLLFEYEKYGPFIAIFFSSICFAMLHFSYSSFLFYFYAGIMLGLITVVCGSVLPAIILHMLSNILTLYLQEGFINYLNQSGDELILLYVLIAAFLILLYLILGQLERYCKLKSNETTAFERKEALLLAAIETKNIKKAKKEQRFITKLSEIFLSPSFILVLVFFIMKASSII